MPKLPKTADDITGRIFHRWKVLAYFGPAPSARGSLWVCQCSCGTIRNLLGGDLRRGNSRSCGCLAVEYNTSRFKGNYGRAPGGPVWYQARARCTNPAHKNYHRYGARGITMCERWRNSFEAFIADMGAPPKEQQLERIDNDKGYWCGKPCCPECGPLRREPNCRWATREEQAHNKRNNHKITFNGETLTLTEWARRLGCSRLMLQYRLKQNWSVERTLTTPSMAPNPKRRAKPR